MVSPEGELWLAVILQAFKDAHRGCERSQRWLLGQSADMRETCALAGVEPGWVAIEARAAGAVPGVTVAPRVAAPQAQIGTLLRRLTGLQNLVSGERVRRDGH